MRKITKTIAASLVAATIGTAAMTAPASAGGSFAITIQPTTQEEAQLMQTGLALYSLFSGMANSGGIQQYGNNNQAGLGQNGYGNQGVIYQEGNGHNGTIQQNGNGNSYGLFQFGENTNANILQNGNGQTGVTFITGW